MEKIQQFLRKGFFWCVWHRKRVGKEIEEIRAENKRLWIENEHLVEYNKKLENHLREKTNEAKKLQKELEKSKLPKPNPLSPKAA